MLYLWRKSVIGNNDTNAAPSESATDVPVHVFIARCPTPAMNENHYGKIVIVRQINIKFISNMIVNMLICLKPELLGNGLCVFNVDLLCSSKSDGSILG